MLNAKCHRHRCNRLDELYRLVVYCRYLTIKFDDKIMKMDAAAREKKETRAMIDVPRDDYAAIQSFTNNDSLGKPRQYCDE
jgi:hypothetical protein